MSTTHSCTGERAWPLPRGVDGSSSLCKMFKANDTNLYRQICVSRSKHPEISKSVVLISNKLMCLEPCALLVLHVQQYATLIVHPDNVDFLLLLLKFTCVFESVTQRVSKRENVLPSIGLLIKRLQWPRLGLAEA